MRKHSSRRSRLSIVLFGVILLICLLVLTLILSVHAEETPVKIIVSAAFAILPGLFFLFKKSYNVELSEDGLHFEYRMRGLFHYYWDIKWEKVTEISANFGILGKDFGNVFLLKKKNMRSNLPQVIIVSPTVRRGRFLFFPVNAKHKKTVINNNQNNVFQNRPELACALVERASELIESKESREFAEKFPEVFERYHNYLRWFQERRKKRVHVFRRENRERMVGRFPFLLLFFALPLLLYPLYISVYVVLLIELFFILILIWISQLWYFRYLPLMPSSYAGLEIWRLGLILCFCLFFFKPATSMLLLFLFYCWVEFSLILVVRNEFRKISMLIMRIPLVAVVFGFFFISTTPPADVYLKNVAWLGNMAVYRVSVSPDQKSVAVTARYGMTGQKDYEAGNRQHFANRISSLVHMFHFFQKALGKEIHDDLFGDALALIEVSGKNTSIKTWRKEATRDCKTVMLLPGEFGNRMIGGPLSLEDTGEKDPPENLLYLFTDRVPEPVEWRPGFTTPSMSVILPEHSYNPFCNCFGVICRDETHDYLTTFDADTITPLVTRSYERDYRDKPARVITWEESKFVRREIFFEPYEGFYQTRAFHSFSPGGSFLADVVERKEDVGVIRIWNAVTEELMEEFPIESSREDRFSFWWSHDGSRLSVFHERELLLFDVSTKEWKRMPVPNGSSSIMQITGAWSIDGQDFYYYQPSILTTLLGGEIYRAHWKKEMK